MNIKWMGMMEPGELMTRTVSGKAIYFRYIPAGKFQRDGTAANVTVITKGYWLGETEVTQEQYQAVMGYNPSNFSNDPDTGEEQEKRPVERVSWYEAIAFCNKLSIADRKAPVYSVKGITNWADLKYDSIPTSWNNVWDEAAQNLNKNGYRLPTEMEWLWAAMGAPVAGRNGGTDTTGWQKGYAGSTESAAAAENIGRYAWYSNNSNWKSHETGRKAANELNLKDMSGNEWEWCWDWNNNCWGIAEWGDIAGELTNPLGPASGTDRVVRGGSWNNAVHICPIAFRSYAPPGRYDIISFRVLCP